MYAPRGAREMRGGVRTRTWGFGGHREPEGLSVLPACPRDGVWTDISVRKNQESGEHQEGSPGLTRENGQIGRLSLPATGQGVRRLRKLTWSWKSRVDTCGEWFSCDGPRTERNISLRRPSWENQLYIGFFFFFFTWSSRVPNALNM